MSGFEDKKRDSGGDVTADDKTIQRDVAPGKSTKVAADQAVNKALSKSGSGTADQSGATFHDDSTSHAAADALGAKAFTAGSDVYFGAGQYSPGSESGDKLIDHELTHVDQSKGVEPPKPGDFRVSKPGDASEVAARSGSSSGAAASASTIMRDDETESETEGTGPAVEGEGGEAAGPDAGVEGEGGEEETEPYDDWKAALNSFNRSEAVSKWASLSAGDKKKAKDETDLYVRIVYVMKKDSVPVIKEAGIPIAEVAGQIFLNEEFADFLAPLRTHRLLDSFLSSGARGHLVNDEKVQKLKTWIDATTSRREAKKIFEKPYPTLHDTAPGSVSFNGQVAMWPLDRIQRLYNVLAQYLDPGHVSTITGGFVYVTRPLFGWWSPSQKRVFLPASSESTGHDMTGGAARGHHATDPKNKKGQFTATSGRSVSPDFKDKDGKDKKGAAARIGHFTGTILHEVGHGVGARIDGGRGNAYAEDSASWPGFNVRMSIDDWANELWAGAGAGSGSEPRVHRNAKLPPDKAKDFFKTELQSGKGSYDAGWGSEPPRDDIATYVKWRYKDVPLQMWWNYFVELKNPKGSAYAWDNEKARLKGGWCYSYLSRGNAHYTKYKDHTWKKKVSWYSLSSPREWFAEQYTHFYRTEKTGAGLDGSTASLLKDLDAKQFAPTNAVDEGGVTIGDSTGGSGGGGGSGDDAGIQEASPGDTSAEAAASEEQPEQEETRPLFLPW